MTSNVEFHFDYASPWAYLANSILKQRLPGAMVRYRPTYLRGLETFSQGMPYVAAKLKYTLADLLRCSAYQQVPLKFPSVFPINGLYGLRGALWTLENGMFAAYHEAIYRAAWVEDRDISNRAGVVAIAAEAGIDPARFGDGIDQEAIKAQLKRLTAEAQDRGIFGVPSFIVGDELFWGHDRMDYVARAMGLDGP